MKDIHDIANVIDQDVIEFLVRPESLLELLLIWESDCEFERWISLLRDFYNLSANVNAFAPAWSNNRQKIARAAANRQDFFAAPPENEEAGLTVRNSICYDLSNLRAEQQF